MIKIRNSITFLVPSLKIFHVDNIANNCRRNKYFVKAAHLAIQEFTAMHEELQKTAVISSPVKRKTTCKSEKMAANSKRAKKRLRDADELENIDKPLEEAVVFLNHLLKIGTYMYNMYRY